jgi:diguanylate cyclase (GGDEF)-like protein
LERLKQAFPHVRNDVVPTKVLIRESCGCISPPLKAVESAPIQGVIEKIREQLRTGRPTFGDWWQNTVTQANEPVLESLLQSLNYSFRTEILQISIEEQTPLLTLYLDAQHLLLEAMHSIHSNKQVDRDYLTCELHRTSTSLQLHTEPAVILKRLAESMVTWCPQGMRLFLFDAEFTPYPPENLMEQVFGLRVAICDGQITPIPSDEDILPNEVIPGDIWTAVLLEQGSIRFGVALFHNWIENEVFVEHLRITISSALSISWKTRSEEKLRETLRRLSVRDELTGMYNRRGLMDLGAHLSSLAVREKKLVCLICVDLNGHKGINDQYGHAEGDHAVNFLAETFRESFGSADVLARLSVDQFAALLVVDDADQHMAFVSHFNEALANQSNEIQRPWKLTTSLGWSVWSPQDGSSIEKELLKIDRILCRNKAVKK